MNALPSKFALVSAMAASLALAGCATGPYGNSGNYDRGYQGSSQGGYGYGDRNVRCQACGVVQEVQQVNIDGNGNGGTLGAIIGAVAGGVVGNQIGKRNDGGGVAWRIVVRLDNGQYATVTQRENPGVRNGDYVEVRGDHVYPR
ncbi:MULTISPECIES: glycine zipper 2TM domain-containing protein [unclassified Rhodanobacter]|uniref:glycine zipper 2TM domain-containing protein n=1 Tax=unclassified Rhodanobacter TaxID=2621553 RepID=UPI0034E3883D